MNHKESGSMAFTVMSVVTMLGVTAMYLDNSKYDFAAALKTTKQLQASALAQENIVSSAGVFKALITPGRDTAYVPAFLAANYYDQDWKLVRNPGMSTQNSHLLSNKSVQVNLAMFDNAPQSDIAAIMGGSKSMTGTNLHPSTITLLKTNFDDTGRHALTADVNVDTEVLEDGVKKSKSFNARIPLPEPIPRDPVLELRAKGTAPWLNASTIDHIGPGVYEFRVKASGIVFDASVELEGIGEIKRVGGFKLQNGVPVISHDANNFAAVDKVIGDVWEYTLDPNNPGNSIVNCSYQPVDGSYKFKLRVNGPSPTQSVQVETNSDVKVHDDNQIIDSSTRDWTYSNMCTTECPYIGPNDEFVIGIENVQFSQQKYSDFTYFQKKANSPLYGVNGSRKLCTNYEKAARLYKDVYGSNPLDYDMMNADEGTYMKYEEYYSYDIPSCRRKFLFTRDNCGCFAEKTLITLGDGITQKPINQLSYDDQVWNPVLKRSFGIRKITKGPEKLPMIRIRVDGKDVTVTGKHPFPTRNGFTTAHSLEVGDEIQIDQSVWAKVEEVQILPPGEKLPDVYNFELDASNQDIAAHNVLANGVVTGDLYIQTILEQDNIRKISSAK